jgi:hypothetical protein
MSWAMSKTTIRLNCLFLPRTSQDKISGHSVTVLKIDTNETFDQLRIMIMNRWTSLFTPRHPNTFIIYKAKTEAMTKISDQIEYYKENRIDKNLEIFPYELISDHFPNEPPNDKIHVIVEC